jgi:phospholipid transport system substrate-binding protein
MFLRESLVYLVVSSLSLAALLFLSRQVMAGSPSPLDVIQSGTEQGLQIIKSSLSGEGPALQQRRNEILKIVDEYFEFGEMSRRSLGRPWKEQTPDKQSEFVRLFKQLLFNTYVSRVEAAATPTTRIVYESEKVEGDYALVKTRAINDQKPAVQIDYRVHLDSAGWKVYDVVIEGVSLVSNYREQFASILSSEPFDSLLKRLREKVAAQAPL